MEYVEIEFTNHEGLAVITLNRPDKMNAMNAAMRSEITHALNHRLGDARVVVLTGSGPAFCSGQDLGDARNTTKLNLERVLRDEYYPMLEALVNCPLPTIAAVNGAAAGAGANLALACDVVIASHNAFFSQAFTRIGLMPDAGGTWFLPRKVGLAKAMGMAFFADRISAREASEMGMIFEAVAAEEFVTHWQRRAQALAAGPTCALQAVKQAMRESFNHDFTEQLNLEAQLQGKLGKTRDFMEGVSAFMEKRPAQFEGR
ncbi:2-(1,2-epoxy-1,2-dihydrophenyl)acetyl-CoA isomerase [Epibacterium sp. SM1979]|uniref:2-(1,2-epoxy-1,2-dihydrophenyl)acetyl-CoA isomerase n=1 Tax=Tritonibacter litoralis TaxID=2662264 RepID=A0A843YC22_9RHOB|nr:enoyl-CoA hydratase-related protein [Tritonibacter litoralis]MQQ07024.1 2-(1,2-epoxy-1,2-dihydrophenyl)acetyl-CoA isomerase [Tritonibacter litoralis]